MVRQGIKENDRGVNSIILYLNIVRTFINATMNPHKAQQ
jgi:hypothetical protein